MFRFTLLIFFIITDVWIIIKYGNFKEVAEITQNIAAAGSAAAMKQKGISAFVFSEYFFKFFLIVDFVQFYTSYLFTRENFSSDNLL